MTYAQELQAILEKNNARWRVNERFLNVEKVPRFTTGAVIEKMPLAKDAAPIDFGALFGEKLANPFILERRVAHGIAPKTLVEKKLTIGSPPELRPGEGAETPPPAGIVPTSVDWRSRWGWPYITSIRNQGGCEACWVFGSVALVESMVRIEHCVWPCISEGDVHKGIGAKCCDCGEPGKALDWIKGNGAADPGCFAWPMTSAAACACAGCEGTGGTPYDNIPYAPSSDRSGRTVLIGDYTSLGSTDDQKQWLDVTGPLVCQIDVYEDFMTYGSGVYHKVATLPNGQPNVQVGGHIMLVVGYDDTQGCWIVKNSWGKTWGANGFCSIAYGECNIDTYAKIGMQDPTNPDGWTKRRQHNGCMLESGNGAQHDNFDMVATYGTQLRQWERDNSTAGFPWNQVATFGNDAASIPTLIQSTYARNFEIVYATTQNGLHHWWFNQPNGPWNDGGIFGPTDAQTVNVDGLGFIQSNYNAPGNFEVVAHTQDGRLNHWWRDGSFAWHDGGRFASNVKTGGRSLIQSHFGTQGNFELVCVLNTGQMQHWWRDNDHGMVWNSSASFGTGIQSPPCMIEGQYGAQDENSVGNFELCVANQNGNVEHWWRANSSDQLWRKSDTFAQNVQSVVALLQGSFSFNLEVIVLRTDKNLQHYWRSGNTWNEGVVIGST
ncbi:MAG TPA: C1 family peptidase [Candidatus Bathyarchaeia archaeon]|nr:C1 family peptidase [Candidatus Bathyarchaeia archaeon]